MAKALSLVIELCKIVLARKYFHTTILRMSSGTFRLALQIAWAEEWEKMTGASDIARASPAACWEVWERSTTIPSLFISCTTVCKWNMFESLLYVKLDIKLQIVLLKKEMWRRNLEQSSLNLCYLIWTLQNLIIPACKI